MSETDPTISAENAILKAQQNGLSGTPLYEFIQRQFGVSLDALNKFLTNGSNGLTEQKKKDEAYATSVAVAQMEVSAYNQKHNEFYKKLETGSLFRSKESFDSDFKMFDSATDDWLNLISTKPNISEAERVSKHNDLTSASLQARKVHGNSENCEAHLRKQGVDVDSNNGLKMMYRSEALQRAHELGLIGDPCKCKSNADIDKLAKFLGVSLEELNTMKLSELKAKIEWVGKYDAMATDKAAYAGFMKNPDPRLDKFRDRDFDSLTKDEKKELAGNIKDITHENRFSQIQKDLKLAGVSDSQIKQYELEIRSNQILMNSSNYNAASLLSWTKTIDEKLVGNIEGALRGQIFWDIKQTNANGQSGFIQSSTYSQFLNSMPPADFNSYAKNVLKVDYTGDKQADSAKLQAMFDNSGAFRAQTSQKLQSSITEFDNPNGTNHPTQTKSIFSFLNSSPTPTTQTLATTAVSAYSPLAGAALATANFLSGSAADKDKPAEAQSAFAALSDSAKAAVNKISESCGCSDKKAPESPPPAPNTPTPPAQQETPPPAPAKPTEVQVLAQNTPQPAHRS